MILPSGFFSCWLWYFSLIFFFSSTFSCSVVYRLFFSLSWSSCYESFHHFCKLWTLMWITLLPVCSLGPWEAPALLLSDGVARALLWIKPNSCGLAVTLVFFFGSFLDAHLQNFIPDETLLFLLVNFSEYLFYRKLIILCTLQTKEK